MAKVRNPVRTNSTKPSEEVATSTRKPRSKTKTSNAATSKTTRTETKEQTASKAKTKNPPKKSAAKKSNVDGDVDSGISSPERPDRTRSSSKKKTNISDKSKKAISKTRKSPIITKVKKITDISWMRALVHEKSLSHPKLRKLMGIEIRYPGALTLRKQKGADYLSFPWINNRCSGFIKMTPGGKKSCITSLSTIHFFVLVGKIELKAADTKTEFNEGALISIPKGVRYGLTNPTKNNTFLRFQVLNS